MTPPPIALGLILCEQVIVDHNSRNPSPINIFNGLAVDEFPSEAQRFSVFAALTAGRGAGKLRLVASRLDSEETVYESEFPISIPDPLLIVNVNIRLRHIHFPVPGWYEFVLFVDADPIAQRRLRVYQR